VARSALGGFTGKRQVVQVDLHEVPARLIVADAKAVEPSARAEVLGLELQCLGMIVERDGDGAGFSFTCWSISKRPLVSFPVGLDQRASFARNPFSERITRLRAEVVSRPAGPVDCDAKLIAPRRFSAGGIARLLGSGVEPAKKYAAIRPRAT